MALAATDAVPGDPLKLGQENRIVDHSTTLSGFGHKNEGVLNVRAPAGRVSSWTISAVSDAIQIRLATPRANITSISAQ